MQYFLHTLHLDAYRSKTPYKRKFDSNLGPQSQQKLRTHPSIEASAAAVEGGVLIFPAPLFMWLGQVHLHKEYKTFPLVKK